MLFRSTAVDKAENEEQKAAKINSEAPANLAVAIGKRGGALVQISTDYVFPGNAFEPINEDCATAPTSAYGRTKLAGEISAQKKCKNTVIIRTAWLYSSFGHNFVKTMIKLGRERDKLGVVFDQIGTPTYARDLARAIMQILAKGVATIPKVQPQCFCLSADALSLSPLPSASWRKVVHTIATFSPLLPRRV